MTKKKIKRPAIKSDLKKIPKKIGWSNGNRNSSTLKKIEKAIVDENELMENYPFPPKIKKPKFNLGIRGFFKDKNDYDDDDNE